MSFYGDEMVYENYNGYKSIENNISLGYNSQYNIASNSKGFVAVGIMQLVEQGKIESINDNINNYLDSSDMAAWGLEGSAWCPKVCPGGICNSQNICEQNIPMSIASLLSMQSGVMSTFVCEAPINAANYPPSYTTWYSQFCIPCNLNPTTMEA